MGSFHLVSLGCAKNLVDSEVILGSLTDRGWQLVEAPEGADILIVNTCGFIQPAVEEAIEEILELVRIKSIYPDKKVVVVGCLVQRYRNQLAKELPEVDLFVGTEGPEMVPELLENLEDGSSTKTVQLPPAFLMTSKTPRLVTTPSFRAWLKITEGCDNRCSYCMIPSIRGNLRSRASDDLVAETQKLENYGVKELSLVAQDSTAYGNDLGPEEDIVCLLEKLLENTSVPWLRLLYLYPTGINQRLIELIAGEERILPYLDIPFQHVSEKVLHRMNRTYNYEILASLIEKLRKAVPGISLRTTFLVGFPGETEEDFILLENFLRNYRIDHVGVFSYANEEGAPSEKYADQVEENEKRRRRDYLLGVQAAISESILQKYVGKTEQVLVEGVCAETDLLLEGRTRYQAPEVDGCVYINEGTANPGELVSVRISEVKTYDLVGGVVE